MDAPAPTLPDHQGHVTGEEVVSIWTRLCVCLPRPSEAPGGVPARTGRLARGSQTSPLGDEGGAGGTERERVGWAVLVRDHVTRSRGGGGAVSLPVLSRWRG